METEIAIYTELFEIYKEKLEEEKPAEIAALEVVISIQKRLLILLKRQDKALIEDTKNAKKEKET